MIKNFVAVKVSQVAVVFARIGSESLQGSGNTDRYLPDELLSAELSAGQMIAVSVHSISRIVLKYQFSPAQRWTKKHIHIL